MFYPKNTTLPFEDHPKKTTGRSCKHGFYKSSIPGLYHIHHVYYWVITPAYQNYYSNRLHPTAGWPGTGTDFPGAPRDHDRSQQPNIFITKNISIFTNQLLSKTIL